MPCRPLADDWLFWDPETIFAYPHSCECAPDVAEFCTLPREPEQLDLFDVHARD
jgi:hypothetical protein